jgi:hypothetical protein
MNAHAIPTLIVLACAVVIGVAGRRLEREDGFIYVGLMLLTLIPAIWIPRFYRDLLLSGGVALLLWWIGNSFWDKLGWALGLGLPLYFLSWLIPGGTSVILIFFTLICLAWTGRSAWRHLLRLKNAQALDPDTRPEAEVEIGGKTRIARETPELAGVDLSRAAGCRSFAKPERFRVPEYVELETEAGLVLVALESVELENVRLHVPRNEDTEQWNRVLALGDDRAPMIQVIEGDKDAYVIGTPSWTRAPADAGYRQSPMLPVFGKGSRLYQVSEAEVDARTWWELILAFVFAIACASVGVLQVLGD